MKYLVGYGTTEGHTRVIAERIGSWLGEKGDQVEVIDTANLPEGLDVASSDAYILLGSLHAGKHQASLVHFVQENLAYLLRKPSAFISASLTAVVTDDKHMADARRCIDQFFEETGWTPTLSTPVAGALLYTKYNWLKKMLLLKISRAEGGDTDTSRDYEYTNWMELRIFVDSFVENLASVPAG